MSGLPTAGPALPRPPDGCRIVALVTNDHAAILTDDEFVALVEQALDGLPGEFRERLGSVAIVVEEEPTPDQLRSVGVRGLYGLYQGVPRTAWGAESVAWPSKITIFRGPLSRAHRHPAALAAAVAETVRHEIAHHFGISDARLHELRDDGPARR